MVVAVVQKHKVNHPQEEITVQQEAQAAEAVPEVVQQVTELQVILHQFLLHKAVMAEMVA